MITSKFKISIASTFLWIGFICAISFMEAWLKFRAPGVTLSIGLGIGQLVFAALNLVEWVFALIIIANLLFSKTQFITLQNTLYFIPLLVLVLQTFWILPALDARAELYIQGQNPTASTLHFYYVGMEVIKVVCLTIFGIKLFNKS